MFGGASLVADRNQRIKNSVVHAVELAFFSNLDGHVGTFKVKQHNGDKVAIYDQTQDDPIVVGGRKDAIKWLEDHLLTEVPAVKPAADTTYQNKTIRAVLDGSTSIGPASIGAKVKIGDYEVAKQLQQYYPRLLEGRSFYSILNVVRRHRAAKRKANPEKYETLVQATIREARERAVTAVPAGA